VSRPRIRLGVGRWDHLTPLALGEIVPQSFDLELVRFATTPLLSEHPELDGAEASGSSAILSYLRGDRANVAIPTYLLSAFRHRCVLVRRDSELTAFTDLKGRRVGLTGWPDTGSTWTRALLRDVGIENADLNWVVGPLGPTEPVGDRIGPAGAPANVGVAPDGTCLVQLLLDGAVDAIMTSKMPPDSYGSTSTFRRLLPDYRADEIEYFTRLGYIPGLHLMVLRREIAEAHPAVVAELLPLLRSSQQEWLRQRVACLDTTPWLLSEVDTMADSVGLDWTQYELGTALASTARLAEELAAQGLTSSIPQPEDVFHDYLRLTDSASGSGRGSAAGA
jgi:4,5-dihydroxyphthalate decarboxylase